jgi:hypothetical protein
MSRRALSLVAGLALFLAARGGQAAQCGRFDVSVIVEGLPLPEYSREGRTYIEALRGKTFTLRVSNPTPERVAVALSVDGRNVIDAKRTSAPMATKWVLFPGQTIEIPGWQVSGETARRFYFTDTSRSYAKWLGDTANVGAIEAVFFREIPRVPRPITRRSELNESHGQSGAAQDAPATEDKRSHSEAPLSAQAPAPSGDVIAKDRAVTPQKESDRFAATGIGERTSFPVEWINFDEDPRPAARVALRYEYRRELVRLGVLPRGDDLAARERARGFEPEYAPDPGRHRSQ